MGPRRILSACLALMGAVGAPACATPYGVEEVPAQDQAAASAARPTCASTEVKVRDDFEGRTKPASSGWSKGRVSDGLPTITTTTDPKRVAVLTSKVAATTEEDAKTTAYLEREVPASGCIAADFEVSYAEEAPFPADAWTYFFWIDASDDLNVSLFRRANYVRLAAQRGGTELERIDVELPPNKWSRVHVELELDSERPVMSISVGKTAAKRVTLAEPLAAPYFVSLGTWSRGPVPAHEFSFDNVRLWF